MTEKGSSFLTKNQNLVDQPAGQEVHRASAEMSGNAEWLKRKSGSRLGRRRKMRCRGWYASLRTGFHNDGVTLPRGLK